MSVIMYAPAIALMPSSAGDMPRRMDRLGSRFGVRPNAPRTAMLGTGFRSRAGERPAPLIGTGTLGYEM
jgi:hypothetical protein